MEAEKVGWLSVNWMRMERYSPWFFLGKHLSPHTGSDEMREAPLDPVFMTAGWADSTPKGRNFTRRVLEDCKGDLDSEPILCDLRGHCVLKMWEFILLWGWDPGQEHLLWVRPLWEPERSRRASPLSLVIEVKGYEGKTEAEGDVGQSWPREVTWALLSVLRWIVNLDTASSP